MDNTFIGEYLGCKACNSKAVGFVNRILKGIGTCIRLSSTWQSHMASVESRMNLFHFVSQVIAYGVRGDFVEVGCHSGESSVIIQRIIQDLDPSRELHVYDSFQGVPEVSSKDEMAYSKGEMSASRRELASNFSLLGLSLPIIHQGWFQDTLPNELPQTIAFALIDADLYESTLVALGECYPRLAKGAACMLGVYCDPTIKDPQTRSIKYRSPGVKWACDEFFTDKIEKVSVLYSGEYTSGYFRKV